MVRNIVSKAVARRDVILFGGAFVVAFAVFIPIEIASRIFFFVGVLITGFAVMLHFRQNRIQNKVKIDYLFKLNKVLSTIEFRTRPLNNTVGSVFRIREDVSYLRENLNHTLETRNLDLSISQFPVSVFSPSAVSVSRQDKPFKHQAGRNAAAQRSTEDSITKLQFLLNASEKQLTRKIVTISDPGLVSELKLCGDVIPLLPTIGINQLSADTSYLVIQETALISGPWTGVLDSQGTTRFLELIGLIKTAKNKGIVVVIVADCIPQHFTSALEEYGNVIVRDGMYNSRWGNNVDSPVLNAIAAAGSK